tara:strand:- start:398 stop:676 length:279 start_codon:yes stop_codon:yes gene_type:complete
MGQLVKKVYYSEHFFLSFMIFMNIFSHDIFFSLTINVKGQQTFVADLTDFGVPRHPLNRQNIVGIFVPFVFPTQAVAGMPPVGLKKKMISKK